jgi:hypothetical protein
MPGIDLESKSGKLISATSSFTLKTGSGEGERSGSGAGSLSVPRADNSAPSSGVFAGRRPRRSVLIIELIIAWGISDRSGSSTNQRPPPTSCYPPHSPPPLGCLLRVTTSTMPMRLESIPLRGQSFSRFSTPFCCRTTSGGPPGTRHMSSSYSPSSAQVSR